MELEAMDTEQAVQAETTAGAAEDLSAAWEAADQPPVREPQEEPEPAPAPAPAPEGLELKYMGEVRQVPREEAVALAQKGMDYDRIRAERDELRGFRAQAAPALELMEGMARRSGMSTEAFLERCRETALPGGTQSGDWEERMRSEALDRDMRDFVSDYPDVKAEDIPKEVWEMVAGGKSLTGAYQLHRIRTLESRLAAGEQDRRSRRTAMGSMAQSASGDSGDLISRWWNEGE